jgi:hypothetical protein
MSDTAFPNPQRDETADDPFESPHDEFGGAMGASPVDPVASARKPQRRTALMLVAGAVLVVILIMVLGAKGKSKGATPPPSLAGEQTKRAEAPVTSTPVNQVPPTATPERSAAPAGPIFDPNNLSRSAAPGVPAAPGAPNAPGSLNAPSAPPAGPGSPSSNGARSHASGAETLPTGASLPGRGRARSDDPMAIVESGAGVSRAGQTPNAPALSDNPLPFPTDGAASVIGTTAPTGSQASQMLREEAANHQRAALQEHAAKVAALREFKKAEEARLKGQATKIEENTSLMAAGNGGGGASRFSAFEASAGSPGASGTSAIVAAGIATGQVSAAVKNDILPGTRVSAVTVSEFISDDQGAGQIEARLTQPLKTRSGVLLPAGTRAFGTASGGAPQVGRPARLTVTFDVFVTPKGDVIRGLPAKGVDPKTLSTTVAAQSDQRYPQRILRGAVSTALDLALTAKAQNRPNAFEQPSPRDRAIEDARARFGAIINGPVGNENSVHATVVLPADTEILLQFGS